MMRAILLLLVLLSGCAQYGTLQGVVADRGAAAADDMRETAEFAICRAITVGSWVRAYGQDKARAEAWKTLCSNQVQVVPQFERN